MKKYFTILALALSLLASHQLQAQSFKPTGAELQSAMHKLWEDHIVWTRNVILNIIDNLPGTSQAVNRLLQNQVDIGNAIKPYYGNSAGAQLTSLLTQHITIAADLLTALKNNNSTAVNTYSAQWTTNADAIAAFLASANPNWNETDLQSMMHQHLALTTAEAVARKTADYNADVAAYEAVHLEILEMADMLTAGIVKQFPNRFSGCPLSTPVKTQMKATVLKQNVPNPAGSETFIRYELPENKGKAQIVVYDDMGTVVKRIDLKNSGAGSVRVDLSGWKQGLYWYSIISDGKVLDSRTMIH